MLGLLSCASSLSPFGTSFIKNAVVRNPDDARRARLFGDAERRRTGFGRAERRQDRHDMADRLPAKPLEGLADMRN